MNALSYFERFVERVMESGVTRLLGSELQPVEVAKKLARAMEREQRFGPNGEIVVPNDYTVALHPSDLEAFGELRTSLDRELAEYLARYAAERGFRPRTRPVVRLEADQSAPRHGVRIAARFLNQPLTVNEADAMSGMTAVMRLSPPIERPLPSAILTLLDEPGLPVPVERLPMALGRALDNDLVIEDLRVSRHHAQIKEAHGRYLLTDLTSTNGTFVNGQRVAEVMLADGDEISLGGARLRFNQEPET